MSGAGDTPKSLPGMFTCVLKESIRSSDTDRRYKVPKSKRTRQMRRPYSPAAENGWITRSGKPQGVCSVPDPK